MIGYNFRFPPGPHFYGGGNLLAAVACVCLCMAGAARAAIVFEVIDRGTPTDGVVTMDGFRAVTIRVRSTDPIDPITRVRFGNVGGFGGTWGDLHQRWTDPTGSGNYTETSPGFYDADNTTPTDLNFDSHYLPPLPGAQVSLLFEAFPDFQSRVPFSPLPSTPFVGYSDPEDVFEPIGVSMSQRMEVIYDLPAALSVTQIDLAYIVTDSVVHGFGEINTLHGGISDGFTVVVPEPSTSATVAALAVIAAALGRRRRRVNLYGMRCVSLMEPLESRQHLDGEAAFSPPAVSTLPVTGGI